MKKYNKDWYTKITPYNLDPFGPKRFGCIDLSLIKNKRKFITE